MTAAEEDRTRQSEGENKCTTELQSLETESEVHTEGLVLGTVPPDAGERKADVLMWGFERRPMAHDSIVEVMDVSRDQQDHMTVATVVNARQDHMKVSS